MDPKARVPGPEENSETVPVAHGGTRPTTWTWTFAGWEEVPDEAWAVAWGSGGAAGSAGAVAAVAGAGASDAGGARAGNGELERERQGKDFKMTDEARRVRIAVASEDHRGLEGLVSAHFGRCPTYTIAEMRGEEIESHRVVENPHYEQHVPGAVPQFLAGLGANVVLAGGMGPRAVSMFQGLGIQVATGVSGTVADALEAWNRGARGITPCQHDHPESCGGHDD